MNILSVDIGGTNFRIGLVAGDDSIMKFDKIPTESVVRSEHVLSDLADFLEAFTAGQQFDAAAIGFPATLDASRTRVVQAPNLSFFENLSVCEILQQALRVPVLAERDVNFALCYDMKKYLIPEQGLTCGIYFGTGIGNAIAIDGRPLIGRHGAAGELGHIPVPGSTIFCGCGNIGCMEAVAGGKALARLQREQYPDTPISEMFVRHAQEKPLAELVDNMASAVATEVNILDPDQVLLGGGVLNMTDFPRKTFIDCIFSHTRKPFPCQELSLIFTEDEAEKSVIGGAIYARRMLRNETTA